MYLSFVVGTELSSDHFVVELGNIRRWFDLCHEGVESLDALTMWILGTAGAVSVFLFTVRGLLDQLPEVFEAWHRARRAIRDRAGNDDRLS
ncbi:hypothetical protein [Streptomyces canus]|uniref:hypothetical protein n=1 Tax=Streptomyces canus TaxID=58343 RepID=UPI002DD81294|nr:hypothetical protein [Streptomyces canus]WSD83073.1 hypothetical protein OG925_01350 [Streptomyces canus]